MTVLLVLAVACNEETDTGTLNPEKGSEDLIPENLEELNI